MSANDRFIVYIIPKNNNMNQQPGRKTRRARRGRAKNQNPRVGRELLIASRPPVVQFTPNVFGFPDRLMTRLRYSDFGTIASTSGGVSSYKFRWNSTFDPDHTGTGHQPLYRDTYAGIYDQYAVVRARARVRFSNQTTSLFFVSLNTDDDTTVSTTATTLAEQSHGVSTIVTALTGSHSYVELVANWDCAQFLNIDPYTSETYKTAVGSDPTEQSILALIAATADGSTATINFQIILEQDVLWTELSTPSQS
jgi:hypothetical protein